MTKKIDLKKHFDENHIPEPMSGCWLWTGGVGTHGYGCVSRKLAHRISWEFHRGPIPKGLDVCHKCDVKTCVNPDHLFVGTRQDNMRDAVRKGRSTRGERQWKSKLNEDKVRYIRNSDKSCRELAAEMGVKVRAIYAVLYRENWKHVK